MTIHTGRIRIETQHAIMHLSRSIVGVGPIIAESIDNGIDAGASIIWIEVEPGLLRVIDNGHGMLSQMLPEDYTKIINLLAQQEQGGLAGDFDIRNEVSEASRRTLQWMAEKIGFSSKIPDPNSDILGIMGMGGTISWVQIFSSAVWTTRPNQELAAADPRLSRKRPAYRFIAPSAEHIRLGQLDYTIEEVDPSLLKNPYGGVLNSGTMVEFQGFSPEAARALRPSALSEIYKIRYGGFIRAGRLTLTIIDRVTEEARRTKKKFREIDVQPSQSRGVLVKEDQIEIPGGPSFGVQLFYDRSGRGLSPALRRQGLEVARLSSLVDEVPSLSRSPLLSGKFTGFVNFPRGRGPEEDDTKLWNNAKTKPLDTPLRNQWERELVQLTEELEQLMAEVDKRAQQRNVENVASSVAQAALNAMQDLDAFQGLLPERRLGEKKKKKTRAKGSLPTTTSTGLDQVIGVVQNEHRRGVAGAKLELIRHHPREGQKLVKEAISTKGGVINFGKQPQGRYFLKVTPPSGATLTQSSNSSIFNLGPNQPGIRLIFQLITGEPAPPPTGRIPNLRIWMHEWPNIDEKYRATRLQDQGTVEINDAAPDLREALESQDTPRVTALTSLYTSLAIAKHAFAGEGTDVVIDQACTLFSRTLGGAMQDQEEQARSRASRRGKK